MSDMLELRNLERRQGRARDIAADIRDLCRAVPMVPDGELEKRTQRILPADFDYDTVINFLTRVQRAGNVLPIRRGSPDAGPDAYHLRRPNGGDAA